VTRFTQTLPHLNPARKIDARAPFPASNQRRKANSSLTFATSCNETCANEYFLGLTRPGFSLIHSVLLQPFVQHLFQRKNHSTIEI